MSDARPVQRGELTAALAGRTVHSITRNGVSIVISFTDGYEVQIGWADAQLRPVEGQPVIVRQGKPVHVHTQTNLSEVLRSLR